MTVLSATAVALALVAQATNFGTGFFVFALLLIPVLVVLGMATFLRLMVLNKEDVGLVAGMNRLRRGYLDLAPDLEPYFVTGHHDDVAGILRTFGANPVVRRRGMQYLQSTPMLVGAIVAVLLGTFAGLACDALGAGLAVGIAVGVIATLAAMGGLLLVLLRQVDRTWRDHRAGFPAAEGA